MAHFAKAAPLRYAERRAGVRVDDRPQRDSEVQGKGRNPERFSAGSHQGIKFGFGTAQRNGALLARVRRHDMSSEHRQSSGCASAARATSGPIRIAVNAKLRTRSLPFIPDDEPGTAEKLFRNPFGSLAVPYCGFGHCSGYLFCSELDVSTVWG